MERDINIPDNSALNKALEDTHVSFNKSIEKTGLRKTLDSKNITVSDWNALVGFCELYLSNVRKIYELLPVFKNYNDLSVEIVNELERGIKAVDDRVTDVNTRFTDNNVVNSKDGSFKITDDEIVKTVSSSDSVLKFPWEILTSGSDTIATFNYVLEELAKALANYYDKSEVDNKEEVLTALTSINFDNIEANAKDISDLKSGKLDASVYKKEAVTKDSNGNVTIAGNLTILGELSKVDADVLYTDSPFSVLNTSYIDGVQSTFEYAGSIILTGQGSNNGSELSIPAVGILYSKTYAKFSVYNGRYIIPRNGSTLNYANAYFSSSSQASDVALINRTHRPNDGYIAVFENTGSNTPMKLSNVSLGALATDTDLEEAISAILEIQNEYIGG